MEIHSAELEPTIVFLAPYVAIVREALVAHAIGLSKETAPTAKTLTSAKTGITSAIKMLFATIG